MTFHTTVLYPNEADSTFDMRYYLSTHIPLVKEKLGPHGLKKCEVLEYQPGPDGSKPAFRVGATLVWDTPEDMGAAMASQDAKPVFEDIPNFYNKAPLLMAGALVATV